MLISHSTTISVPENLWKKKIAKRDSLKDTVLHFPKIMIRSKIELNRLVNYEQQYWRRKATKGCPNFSFCFPPKKKSRAFNFDQQSTDLKLVCLWTTGGLCRKLNISPVRYPKHAFHNVMQSFYWNDVLPTFTCKWHLKFLMKSENMEKYS